MTKPAVRIRIQGTPNPRAAKFVLDRDVPGAGSRSYFDRESADGDLLAARIFEVRGVRALLIVENFITVTKTDERDWPDLVDEVTEAIRESLREPADAKPDAAAGGPLQS